MTKVKKYSVKDLNIHVYGRGFNKKFIMYTDFTHTPEDGPRWHTQVYPDIEGNKAKATKQALRWLNSGKWDYYNIFTGQKKISIVYNGPQYYCETDGKGELLLC